MATTTAASLISLCLLIVHNSASTILLHYSQTATDLRPYSAAAAVLLAEIIKTLLCTLLAIRHAHQVNVRSAHSVSFKDTVAKTLSSLYRGDVWTMFVPAACYVVQNNLGFFAARRLDIATFQITYQMKILTTALFSILMLNRTLTPTKWLSLACLLGGIAVVQLTGPSSHEDKLLDVTMHASDFGGSRLSGLLAALAGCTTSGFAGVYIEQLIKSSSTDLWTRNAQLSLWSLPAAYIAALQAGGVVQQLSHLRSAPATASVGLFTGIKGWAFVTVLFQAVGGLLTALVLKFANTIAKSFATSLSAVVSCLVGVVLFDNTITPGFFIGATMVLAATYVYNLPDRVANASSSPINAGSPPIAIYSDAIPLSSNNASRPPSISRDSMEVAQASSVAQNGGLANGHELRRKSKISLAV